MEEQKKKIRYMSRAQYAVVLSDIAGCIGTLSPGEVLTYESLSEIAGGICFPRYGRKILDDARKIALEQLGIATSSVPRVGIRRNMPKETMRQAGEDALGRIMGISARASQRVHTLQQHVDKLSQHEKKQVDIIRYTHVAIQAEVAKKIEEIAADKDNARDKNKIYMEGIERLKERMRKEQDGREENPS